MTTPSFTVIQTLAVAAAVLAAGVAAFQLAVAAGAPLGDAVLGGNAPTNAGVLTAPFRAALAAPHPVERWVMGSIILILTGIGLIIALRAPARA